jgi:hypothetical protein
MSGRLPANNLSGRAISPKSFRQLAVDRLSRSRRRKVLKSPLNLRGQGAECAAQRGNFW